MSETMTSGPHSSSRARPPGPSGRSAPRRRSGAARWRRGRGRRCRRRARAGRRRSARAAGTGRPPGPPGSAAGSRCSMRRQLHGERRRPCSGPALAACDRAAVQLDQVLDDGQAEPEAAVARAWLELSAWRKRSKTCGRNSGAMPLPVSVTTISTCGVHALQPHLHAAAARRELDGVREQVPDDLLQAVGVARDGAGPRVEDRLQADALGLGRRPDACRPRPR